MKFSVVIPALNEENYIGDLLNCLALQELQDFEVIVVDGKSNDATQKKVREFKDMLNLTLLISDKRGVGHQRNMGAEHAKSKNLIFFDADVLIGSDFLKKIYEAFGDGKYDVLTSYCFPVSKKKRDKITFWAFNTFYLEVFKRFRPGSSGAFICVKKKVFNDIGGFDETLPLAEDFDLIHRLFKKKYKYKLLSTPKFGISVRRLDKMGRFNYYKEMSKGAFFYHLKGSKGMDSDKIDYDMSGKIR